MPHCGVLPLTLSDLFVNSVLSSNRVWLAQCGALVDAVDYNQQTALMIAIFSGAALSKLRLYTLRS